MWSVPKYTKTTATGYANCSCRDCFEIAIPTSLNDGLCHACEGAGCEAHAERECAAPGAYAAGEES